MSSSITGSVRGQGDGEEREGKAEDGGLRRKRGAQSGRNVTAEPPPAGWGESPILGGHKHSLTLKGRAAALSLMVNSKFGQNDPNAEGQIPTGVGAS